MWLLLAAVLLLRVVVPAGWMPTVEQGGIRLALCNGVGSEFLTLGSDGKLHKEAPKPAAPHDPCPFALTTGMAANLPSDVRLPQPPAVLTPPDFAELTKIALALRKYPRPPARGPPTLA